MGKSKYYLIVAFSAIAAILGLDVILMGSQDGMSHYVIGIALILLALSNAIMSEKFKE